MKKTLIYRLFRIGQIPLRARQQIEREGVVMQEEGIAGSVTFKDFRAPGKSYSHRRNWFSGSLILTEKHLLAFRFSRSIIGVAWDDPRARQLEYSLEDENSLLVAFDASTFNEEWSGRVELRFSTAVAADFLHRIEQYLA